MKGLPRIALIGFLTVLAVVHGIVGWWQPIQATDWEHLLWDVHHDRGWLATHLTSCDILGYALTHGQLLHALVCAAVGPALVLGAFAVERRRLPRLDAWGDVLGVIAISALIWITQPRAGLTWFHRTNVAWYVFGCAAALWLVAPFRCGWHVRRSGMVALAIAGLIVGTSSRQIAAATLISLAAGVRGTPNTRRARWMWVALGALLVGTMIGFRDTPRVSLSRVIERGLDVNLALLSSAIREEGQVLTLLLLLALAKLSLDQLRPGTARSRNEGLPDPRATYVWFWTWLGLCTAALFGPRYSEATLLPATLVLVIAALPYVRWLCSSRVLHWTIVTVAIGVHAIVWPIALALFARLGGEFGDRMARLARAPAGAVAVVAPYSEVRPSSWFLGEDWASPSRQLIGIALYGVRDIELEPRFGWLEDNPHLEIGLESDGLTGEQLREASPLYWASDPGAARDQFRVFVSRARRAVGKAFAARLAVRGLEFPERRGRPLQLAWYERGVMTAPRVTHGSPDPDDRRRVTAPPLIAEAHPEAYVVRAGVAVPVAYGGAAYRVQATVAGLVAVVACDSRRCLLIDAFLPKL